MRHAFFMLCCGILIYSLTQCEDSEPEIFGIEPAVQLKFFNLDSVQQLQNQISNIDSMIKDIDDSLDVLDAMEDQGMGNFDVEQEALNAEKDSLEAVQQHLGSQKRDVENGLIKLDSLIGEGGAQSRIFTDTFDAYRFPLNTHADVSRFFIFFNRRSDTLTLFYTRNTLEKEGSIVIEAILDTTNILHSFDSVSVECRDDANCLSDDATLDLYF